MRKRRGSDSSLKARKRGNDYGLSGPAGPAGRVEEGTGLRTAEEGRVCSRAGENNSFRVDVVYALVSVCHASHSKKES